MMPLKELKEKLLPLSKGVTDFQLRDEIFIPNLEQTVKSLIKYLEANSGKKAYLPYYNHLNDIYEKLK